MGLFSRTPPETPVATRPPLSLWADAFGLLATRALQVLIVVAVVVGIVWVLRSITLITIPFVLALIIASALAPAMDWMTRHGVPSLVATLISLLTILALLGGVGFLIVETVRYQWDDLFSQAQAGFREFAAWAQNLPFFPTAEELDQLVDQVTGFLTSAQFGSGAIAGVGAVASFATGAVLLVTILFFFLKDGPRMWEFVLRPFRGERYDRARRIGDKTVTVFGASVSGTAAIAAVDAIGILIGLLILQVPLAVPLAVLVFVLAFIPIVGATVAGTLAALVALVANGWVSALIVVGVVVLVNQLEGNLLQPLLMGKSVKLNSFVVLIALAIGAAVGGVVGAILAVPITAAAWGVVQVWDGPNTPARWARPRAREQALE